MTNLMRLIHLGFSAVKGLKGAIAEFQRFHGLEETGELDSVTKRTLDAPRFCGCPDAMFADVRRDRWPDPHIYWGFATEWPSIGTDKAREAISWAVSQWERVCDIRFTFCESKFPDEARSRCLISCVPIDGAMGALAQSQLPHGSDGRLTQQYDSAERFVFSDRPGTHEIDLGAVACHEMGHFIGIPHIRGGNLMQPTYDPRIRVPQAGDIAEAVARYGPPKNPSPPAPPGQPAERYVIEGVGIKITKA